MFIKSFLLAAATAAMLTACSSARDTPTNIIMHDADDSLETPDIAVTRVGVFKDSIAYHGIRGVYRIIDKKTGKEFIGVSGIGVGETGSLQVQLLK